MLKKKKKNLASYRFKALPRWPDMKNGYQHAFHNQLFLGAYLHGKCVMLLACERVITCRVRAFTLFPEILKAYLHGTTLSHATSLRQAYDMT